MSREDIVRRRTALDQEIREVNRLIHNRKLQEAEERMHRVEGLFKELEDVIDHSNQIQARILWNERSELRVLTHDIEEGLDRREAGKKENGNIAFKCNWNDKGYKGVCSDDAYQVNIDRDRRWCCVQHGKCREYVDVFPPPLVCYESRALLDCNFGAGWDHDENGEGKRPRKIQSVRQGKVALLTTESPTNDERLLIGAYAIAQVRDDPGVETFVLGDKNTALDDMLEYEIRFWDHYKNPNNPQPTAWGTGLFRYLSDFTVRGILEEYRSKAQQKGKDTSRVEQLMKLVASEES
jgi:hypothetical protein